uniref:Uncharacterized protein n=1 Tax=Glossina pallidipes TaxID=7398 RepID=A0A1A9ZSQ2_GLOPL
MSSIWLRKSDISTHVVMYISYCVTDSLSLSIVPATYFKRFLKTLISTCFDFGWITPFDKILQYLDSLVPEFSSATLMFMFGWGLVCRWVSNSLLDFVNMVLRAGFIDQDDAVDAETDNDNVVDDDLDGA